VRRLAAPLRLTWGWDWPPLARAAGAPPRRPPADLAAAVGAEIVRSSVLLLEVGYPTAAALAEGGLAAALAGFAGALSLVLEPGEALALGGERPWEGTGAEVWLDLTPVPGGPPPTASEAWPSVRISLTARTVEAAAAALRGALEAGATAVSLPNLPLFGEVLREARELAPRPEHLAAFAELVAPALAARPGTDLRVHHYGLLEELHARGLAPHGEEAPGAPGCQAGTALAYVDPAGVLYPCASLPVPLARVGAGTITAAWADGELAALRERIAAVPPACRGCPAEASCRGGCRGWAHYLGRSWEATGPDCTRGR